MKKFAFILFALFVAPAFAADTLPADQTSCEAAGGKWGPQGLSQRIMCDMPTKDAGKACKSSDDCEAKLCIGDKSANKEHGKCYDRTSRFGCHSKLDNGHKVLVCID